MNHTPPGPHGQDKSHPVSPASPAITLVIEATKLTVRGENLADENFLNGLEDKNKAESKPAKVYLNKLQHFHTAARIHLIDYLASLKQSCVYSVRKQVYDSLYPAILALIPDDLNLEGFVTARPTVIETIAVLFGTAPVPSRR